MKDAQGGERPGAGERVGSSASTRPRFVRWIPLAYAVAASAWIAGSDVIFAAISPSVEILAEWSIAKGFVFVAVTTLGLHAGLRWTLACDRRAREALRRYELLAEHGQEVIIFVRASDGRILDANAAAVAVYGYTRDELRSLTVFDLRGRDGAHLVASQMAAADAGGVRFEAVHRRKDGSAFPVEVSAEGSTLDGVRVLVSAVRDITERKRAEEALRESEERLALAVEAVGVGTFDVIPWDELKLSDRSREILDVAEGKRISDFEAFLGLVHAEDRDRVLEAMARWLDGGGDGRYSEEYRCVRSDGSVRWVSVHGIARFVDVDGARTPVRLVGTILDVTERRRTEEQLKAVQTRLMQSDRMASIGTLAAGVAHEINNPLAYVKAGLDFLGERLPEVAPPGDARGELLDALADAQDGVARVRRVVRDLGTFSSMRVDRREAIDIQPVVEAAINLAAGEIRPRARLVRAYASAPRVVAHEARLGQVVLNLLINAAQATPEGRAEEHEIRVSIGTDARGRASIEVSDTGRGLPAGAIDRVFDPFFTMGQNGIGTGLGLSICRNIVLALGGEIRAERRAGRGTTLRVALPAAPEARAAPEPASDPEGDVPAPRGRVLVVDDEPGVANAIRRMLATEHDVAVMTRAEDARDAIARGERFDAILCDLMMPQMTGMELHAELERLAPDQADRMVVMTGGAFTEGGRAFLERVALPTVEKPFDPRSLKTVVRTLVT